MRFCKSKLHYDKNLIEDLSQICNEHSAHFIAITPISKVVLIGIIKSNDTVKSVLAFDIMFFIPECKKVQFIEYDI